MSSPIRIVVGDDHGIVREGLKTVLSGPEFEVVGEATDGEEAVTAVRLHRPDVVLLDLQMPIMSGLDAAKRILAETPGVKILILTTFAEEKRIMECLKAGVHGYVIKDVEKLDLKRHIRAVVRGEAIIDPKVAGLLMAKVRSPQSTDGDRLDVPLTPQQLAILRQVAQGFSNREIGERLSLSENTIKGHVAEVLHRLGAKNRVEASLLASARGWL